MNIQLQIILLICCFFTLWYVIRKINKSQLQIEDAVFWIIFMILLLIISFLPWTVIWVSELLGISSPANFVFLFIIFVFLLKGFSMSIHISQLDSKIQHLTQWIALDRYENGKNDNPD